MWRRLRSRSSRALRTAELQTIGEVDALPVVRDLNGQFPFWSPDGDFVAFGSTERLQKVAASRDRAAQELCACDARWGGSWGRNDTVVFAGDAGVFRIPSEGGEAMPVTRVGPSRGELSHRFPVLYPTAGDSSM